jgi:hypothetical protein
MKSKMYDVIQKVKNVKNDNDKNYLWIIIGYNIFTKNVLLYLTI